MISRWLKAIWPCPSVSSLFHLKMGTILFALLLPRGPVSVHRSTINAYHRWSLPLNACVKEVPATCISSLESLMALAAQSALRTPTQLFGSSPSTVCPSKQNELREMHARSCLHESSSRSARFYQISEYSSHHPGCCAFKFGQALNSQDL